jgi:hypothetical protein
MERTKIKNELNALLDAIVEQSPTFIKSEMPSEEAVALLMHKIEKLQQQLVIYNYVNTLPEMLLENTASEMPTTDETPSIEPNETTAAVVEETIAPSANMQEEKPVEIIIPVQETTPPEPEVSKTVIASPPIATPIKEQASNIATSNKKDIKALIGFNDKFLFTNELFNGESNDFATALSQLNNADNLISANNYLESLQRLYNWNVESASYKRLVGIVAHLFA